ncbi:MAG: 50S ribosomal protein L23 [Spirochaetia bacterium]|nr:50S ribosomal protein L23 [Spirochaetia bacterium]
MNIYDVLKKPIITEKAEALREKSIYVFEIDKRANKKMVSSVIEKIYGVKPVKVNVARTRGKTKTNRYGLGRTSSKKKAYVFLNKKDKIEIFEGV